MARSEIKFPKKGAVAKLRGMVNNFRNQPASPELVESLRKRPEKFPEKKPDRQPGIQKEEFQRKIAAPKRKREPDLGL